MKSINKKGQLGILQGAVIMIAAIGLLLAIAMYVLANMNPVLDTDDVSVTVVNQSGWLNSSGYTVTSATAKNFASFTVVSVLNGTSNATITAANYTATAGGVLKNATAVVWNPVKITYTYTYSAETAASNATNTLVDQFVDFLPWTAIILLVIAASVVLFFVIRSFNGQKGV